LATFGATDLESNPSEQTRLVEGRFPPASDIIDQTRKHAKLSFWVDPLHLARALKAIHAVGCDEDNSEVEIIINQKDVEKPFMIRADKREDGVKAEAIVMPLERNPEKGKAKKTGAEEKAIDPAGELAAFLELEKVKAERDALAAELARVKDEADQLRLVNEDLHKAIRKSTDQFVTPAAIAPSPGRVLSRRERLQRLSA
jgi:hypothetical protein